ncbi:SusC/RagA family TonB-linked outer membrane protein [Tupanvirus soda lake]|uniref:SusC/RagA family TonB-linked outer membrane protein n=2 Tax=Tupanvirus TaxID=2094720 RepID=A0A6N1NST1_9VIRU|nr:SusC/RagA family TonB-linked outer membrane protein [Tupanvirus soda lake]QKU35507.1 SusC/RagA family TonB-linked outer membrane protein [Tupanvirus soda lake]
MSSQLPIGGVWKDFFNYLSGQNKQCCTIKNLSHDSGKSIYVAKICDSSIVTNYSKNFDDNNKLYLAPNSRLFIAVIPNKSKIFFTPFCCEMTMENVHSKFNNFGLALEGCFNIEPITLLPSFYQGYEYSKITGDIVETLKKIKSQDIEIITTTSPNIPTEQSFLVIDNHNTISIVDSNKFKNYQSKGVNVQYIEGKNLFSNGEPFIKFDTIRNINMINKDGSTKEIDGSNIVIDYENNRVNIKNDEYDFSEINNTFSFVNQEFFDMDNGLLVFAIDKDDNIFILYHRHIDFYNMLLLLRMFNCKDAILLCNSVNANIIWKESGFNTYNKTDFIGNPKTALSNIITISG